MPDTGRVDEVVDGIMLVLYLVFVIDYCARSGKRSVAGSSPIPVCAVLRVYVASLAILEAEPADPNSPINNFGDALWWSISGITSVGYGDLAPTTLQGHRGSCNG